MDAEKEKYRPYKTLIDLVYNYEDCSIGFKCPRCGKDLIVDSKDGWILCDPKCGLEYSLSARIHFREGLCGEQE